MGVVAARAWGERERERDCWQRCPGLGRAGRGVSETSVVAGVLPRWLSGSA